MKKINSFFTLIKSHFTIDSIKLVLDLLSLFSIYLFDEFILLDVMIRFGHVLIRMLVKSRKS